ncbi:MAG: acyl-CoA carboxylase subunit beta [Bifidobacteriaceae bacterium]|nr:acyl-CoA carboxylase subunit beta [Bifidobacteriaceae bacterium]
MTTTAPAQTAPPAAPPAAVGQRQRPGRTQRQLEAHAKRIEAAIEQPERQARAKQHGRGRQTARERIAYLLDAGSFIELDALVEHQSTAFGLDAKRVPGDGVVTGYGTVDGRQVVVFAQDFTVFGGSLGEAHGAKIAKAQDLALRLGVPIIGVSDGGGARIQEGVAGLTQFAEMFRRNVAASGVIPQISLILGPSAGGAVYSPALTDFIVMAKGTSHMFITGPDVIKTVLGQEVSFEELGGAATHTAKSGVAHYAGDDEHDAIDFVKNLLSYLPPNNLTDPPVYPPQDPTPAPGAPGMPGVPAGLDPTPKASDLALDGLIPDFDNQPYDIRRVLEAVLDYADYLELQADYAPNIITAFGRVEGRPVGVVANQPLAMAGALDIAASEKAARFVRTCDAFGVPVLTFVDVPGFLPGTDQEWDGIIRRGAKLIYAYAEATVPLVTVITRKAYGGAYIVMGSKKLGADINLAWPSAQIAVMGAEGAVNILHRRELAAAAPADQASERARLVAQYEDALVGPYEAAKRGYLDGVIQPHQTRFQVAAALRALATKRTPASNPKKHGNEPL